MSRLRIAFGATFVLAAQTAWASQNIAYQFASCTGRLSAQMEHEWVLNDPAATTSEAERRAMITLLDAVSYDQDQSQVLMWRIEAKFAQANLLTRATFNADHDDAAWAHQRAKTEIIACRGLLLS